jgi:quercetin dioxygenase-like cupin family protein
VERFLARDELDKAIMLLPTPATTSDSKAQPMRDAPPALAVNSTAIELSGLQIPGAIQEGANVQLLNLDGARGLVATIIHLQPGALIPAHFHEGGSEAHFVLDGDLIDAGRTFGPGAYLTHAAGVVHGPHSSVGGCRVLTVRSAEFSSDDHNLADAEVIQVFLTSESQKHQPPSFLRGTKVALPQITRQIQRPARKGHTALSGTVPNRRTIVPFAESISVHDLAGLLLQWRCLRWSPFGATSR